VNAARVLVATTPGLSETLARDGRKAASFYARFRVTERMLRDAVHVDVSQAVATQGYLCGCYITRGDET
jgi:hypothetical protein